MTIIYNWKWNKLATSRPKVKDYYKVKDIYGSTTTAFLNQNRTWTVVDAITLVGDQPFRTKNITEYAELI